MALKYVCDGCDAITDDKEGFAEAGPINRIYCDKCMGDVSSYQAERDKLHGKVAKTFQTGLEKIRVDYRKTLGRLPDE